MQNSWGEVYTYTDGPSVPEEIQFSMFYSLPYVAEFATQRNADCENEMNSLNDQYLGNISDGMQY
jgi:hypothetical protein